MSDFIEKDVYEQLDFSIYHISLLKQVANKPGSRSDLLQNIANIASTISET